MAAGMAAGHTGAGGHQSRRPGLPVGLSLAIVDDQVVGDDASVRDRKRAEVYGMWAGLARDDDFIACRTRADRYDGDRFRSAAAATLSRCRSPAATRDRACWSPSTRHRATARPRTIATRRHVDRSLSARLSLRRCTAFVARARSSHIPYTSARCGP